MYCFLCLLAPAHQPKEQYLPASVLEEHSTFSTLLDNHSQSTYSEYNEYNEYNDEAEYVLPLQLQSDHNNRGQEEHNSNTTIKLGSSAAVGKKAANLNAGARAINAHNKAVVNNSPQKAHYDTKAQHQHQHHAMNNNHVQFQVSDDIYSDRGDEEGVPMSAPTAGAGMFTCFLFDIFLVLLLNVCALHDSFLFFYYILNNIFTLLFTMQLINVHTTRFGAAAVRLSLSRHFSLCD